MSVLWTAFPEKGRKTQALEAKDPGKRSLYSPASSLPFLAQALSFAFFLRSSKCCVCVCICVGCVCVCVWGVLCICVFVACAVYVHVFVYLWRVLCMCVWCVV